jgi:hypothetical protein
MTPVTAASERRPGALRRDAVSGVDPDMPVRLDTVPPFGVGAGPGAVSRPAFRDSPSRETPVWLFATGIPSYRSE